VSVEFQVVVGVGAVVGMSVKVLAGMVGVFVDVLVNVFIGV
jgi:hypothetical protein